VPIALSPPLMPDFDERFEKFLDVKPSWHPLLDPVVLLRVQMIIPLVVVIFLPAWLALMYPAWLASM
jgi:hypothetical protein